MSSETISALAESWRIFTSHVQPRRLLQEDYHVTSNLWFGRGPTDPNHKRANLLRLVFAIIFSPIYILIPYPLRPFEPDLIKRLLWSIEWAKTPDAVLLESPGSLIPEPPVPGRPKKIKVACKGQYAVTGNKPRWLLKVEFCGTEIVNREQVRYEWERETGDDSKPKSSSTGRSLRKQIQELGYTAISYSMRSAEELFFESGCSLDPQPEIQPGGKQKYSIRNRQNISQALLNEYAHARKTVGGKQDGFEFIWLDEFCLADDSTQGEQAIRKERDNEVGQLADIFRGARRVVVFCHVEECNHTGIHCPWANRLFTLSEILYTPEVLQMTRTKQFNDQGRLSSFIAMIPGSEFRSDMQACAAEAKQWHLYNIMQHATNSGAVPWQSAIHSLVVEAIRRDEADNFHAHNFLGKALNGLLPRRSQLEDLRGINGWADLAWLLELNQAYYNAALLAAVCKLADNDVEEYRWWGKPIAPREGSERLEALVHAIPVTIRNAAGSTPEPLLSIVGPESITLSHGLQRQPGGFYRNVEMRSLMRWSIGIYLILVITSIIAMIGMSFAAGLALLYITSIALTLLQLLAGTIFVEKDGWVVIEDHTIIGRDIYHWLWSQDPTFDMAAEWGARQLIPQWDTPNADPSPPGTPPRPYAVTLIDLRTGVFTRAAVTKRPNCMVPLAIHGSGITCMLLDRNETIEAKPTTAVKVGMANLPPYVLAQAEKSGTIYVGSRWTKPVRRRVDVRKRVDESTPLLSSSAHEV